jgi:ribosomal protein S18 acetylase RimI-like enzyme
MTLVVRPATRADADLISVLNTEVQALHAAAVPWWFKPAGPESFPPEAAAAIVANPVNIVLIAEIDAAPAGYAYAEVVSRPETPWRYAYQTVYLHHIGVLAGYRRQGAGAALLDAVRAAVESRGITLVTLDTWTFNEDARAFFRRHGFAPYNERLWNR